MMDFEKMLTSLANGDEPDLMGMVKKKKNAPNLGSLLPSEQAMSEVGEGAKAAVASYANNPRYMPMATSAPETGAASSHMGGGGQSAAAGAGMGVLQGIQDATKPNAWIAPPAETPSIRDSYIQNALQPPPPMEIGMAYGGVIPPGGAAQVGDEQVMVDADGNAHVIPNDDSDQRAKDAVRERLLKSVQNQPVTTQAMPQTDAPMQAQPQMGSLMSATTAPEQNGVTQTENGYDSSKYNPNDDIVGIEQGLKGKPNLGSLIGSTDDLDSLYQQLYGIQSQKTSKWKDAGYGLLQGVANSLNHTNNPIQSYGDVQKAQQARPIVTKIGMIEGRQNRDAVIAAKQAQAERYRTMGQHEMVGDQSKVIDDLQKTGFDPANPTPAQVARLRSVGLTPESVGKLRPSNPRRVKVGGVEWEQDPVTGNYHDSGLPHDATAEVVPMQVFDVDGKDMGTFQVSQKDKADFTTRLVAEGYKTRLAEVKDTAKGQQDYDADTAKYDADVSNNLADIDGMNKQLGDLDKMEQDYAPKWNDAQERKRELETKRDSLDPNDADYKESLKDINSQLKDANDSISDLEKGYAKIRTDRSKLKSDIITAGGKKFAKPTPPQATKLPSNSGLIGKPVPKSKDPLGLFR